MFERFTDRARNAVTGAADEARTLGAGSIGAEHLLLAMLRDDRCLATRVLAAQGIQRSAVLREVTAATDHDAEALRVLGIDLEEVRRRTEAAFGPGALDRPTPSRPGDPDRPGRFGRRRGVDGRLPFADPAKAVLAHALQAAVDLGHDHIGTEHLLLGLVADEHSGATIILRRLGMSLDLRQLRAVVVDELGRAA